MKEHHIDNESYKNNLNVNINKMAAWEKHTTGFGKKLLEKMGFKGRLGKKEHGVIAPVEVNIRPNEMGLGYGNFKKIKNNKLNKNKNNKTNDFLNINELSDYEEDNHDGMWRKRKAMDFKINKRKKKNIIHMLNKEENDIYLNNYNNKIDNIIDMRGYEEKILENFDNINGTNININNNDSENIKNDSLIGKELLYNINMIVDSSKNTIMELTFKNETNEKKKDKIINEKNKINERKKNVKDKIDIYDSLLKDLNILEYLQTKINNFNSDESKNNTTFSTILDHFEHIKQKYPEEYNKENIFLLISSFVSPIIKKQCSIWNPLNNTSNMSKKDDIMITLELLYKFLIAIPENDNNNNSVLTDRYIEKKRQIYDDILSKSFLPCLRSYLLNNWKEIKSQSIDIIILLRNLQNFLSNDILIDILINIIFPKLKKALEGLNEMKNNDLHEWFLPWKNSFNDEKNEFSNLFMTLYPVTRQIISRNIMIRDNENYNYNDKAHEILLIWKKKWEATDYAIFTNKYIIPQFISVLKKNISNQDVLIKHYESVIDQFLQYENLLSEKQFFGFLEGEFFPIWHNLYFQIYLKQSNSSDNNLTFVEFYQSWKKRFPTHLFEHHRIRYQFQLSLKHIEVYNNRNTKVQTFYHSKYPDLSILPKNYKESLVFHTYFYRQETVEIDNENSINQTKNSYPANTIQFKHVVERLARDNNIVFVPKNKKYEGKTVYSFNNKNIVIIQDLVWVQTNDIIDTFIPIDLEELVQMVK